MIQRFTPPTLIVSFKFHAAFYRDTSLETHATDHWMVKEFSFQRAAHEENILMHGYKVRESLHELTGRIDEFDDTGPWFSVTNLLFRVCSISILILFVAP